MLAVVTIVGRTGRDSETKYREDGSAMHSFSVAVAAGRKVKDQWVEETDWYRVTSFGKAGEGIKKGDLVVVSGALRVKMNKGNDGKMYLNADVNASNVRVIERAASKENHQAKPDDKDEEIPF